MSQFGQPHSAASLFGQARGYVGSTNYGALTAALRDRPDAVVLLDEFEKAHPAFHKRFLTAWNDGFVTETSDGAKVPTNETVFILTTNAASRRIGEIGRDYRGDAEERDRRSRLRCRTRPSLRRSSHGSIKPSPSSLWPGSTSRASWLSRSRGWRASSG